MFLYINFKMKKNIIYFSLLLAFLSGCKNKFDEKVHEGLVAEQNVTRASIKASEQMHQNMLQNHNKMATEMIVDAATEARHAEFLKQHTDLTGRNAELLKKQEAMCDEHKKGKMTTEECQKEHDAMNTALNEALMACKKMEVEQKLIISDHDKAKKPSAQVPSKGKR